MYITSEWRKHDQWHNALAVTVLRYSAGIVERTVEELVSMDRKT